jgi:hypothetical protein
MEFPARAFLYSVLELRSFLNELLNEAYFCEQRMAPVAMQCRLLMHVCSDSKLLCYRHPPERLEHQMHEDAASFVDLSWVRSCFRRSAEFRSVCCTIWVPILMYKAAIGQSKDSIHRLCPTEVSEYVQRHRANIRNEPSDLKTVRPAFSQAYRDRWWPDTRSNGGQNNRFLFTP